MRRIAYCISLAVIFTIPWEGAILVGEWGTLSRILGYAMAGAWMASFLISPRLRRPHPLHLAMLAFVLWNTASVFWTVANAETLQRIKTYGQLGCLSWIFWDLYTTPKALKAALNVYIWGAYVTIGGTVYNYISGAEINPYSGGRYSGVGLNAIEVTIVLALGLPIAWHLAKSLGPGFKNRILRILYFAFIPASIFAMTLTASRTFLLAIIPFALYVIVSSGRVRLSSRILTFAVMAGVLIILLYYTPRSAIERLGTIGSSIATLDFGGRGNIWREATAIFAAHPLLGIGSGALHATAVLGTAAHNTLLSIAAELGLVGIFIFGCMLAIVAHQTAVQPRGLSSLWATVFATWLIGSASLTWEFTKPTWLFLNLIVISANAVEALHPIRNRVYPASFGREMRPASALTFSKRLGNPL